MGGSGGGGGGYRLNPSDIDRLRKDAQERLERSRLDSQVNSFLQHELVDINDRDTDAIERRLDEIEQALRQDVEEFDRILLGGSVAKHTYVDGLSDIDSLVVLSRQVVGDRAPEEMREEFRTILRQRMNIADVSDIEVGRMAVTITYRDDTQIQLLPAVERADSIAISSSTGKTWTAINPKEFAECLTQANRRQGGGVIPAIKIAKAIIANTVPENERPSGYHVEALALAAFERYTGPRTPKAMTQHFFQQASRSVLQPIPDVTGQSRHVDDALGEAHSSSRLRLARQLTQLSRRMERANSVAEWERLLED